MRKLIVPAIALLFIAAAVAAQACDNDNNAAKKVNTSKAETKVEQASVQTIDANMATTQATKDGSSSCTTTGKAADANQVNSGSCCSGSKAKATTTEARGAGDGAKVINANDVCPVTGKNARQASSKDKIVENTGASKAGEATVVMAPKTASNEK